MTKHFTRASANAQYMLPEERRALCAQMLRDMSEDEARDCIEEAGVNTKRSRTTKKVKINKEVGTDGGEKKTKTTIKWGSGGGNPASSGE